MVADLDLSFNDGTNLILETFDESGNYAYQLGVIFEQVGATNADGTFKDGYHSDGVHPDSNGYDIMEQILLAALQ